MFCEIKTLFIIALIGGSIGGILGMILFHHKTKTMYFVIGFPLILFVEVAILALPKLL